MYTKTAFMSARPVLGVVVIAPIFTIKICPHFLVATSSFFKTPHVDDFKGAHLVEC
jgi:hypothetical protein